jgi:hypothetical protein
MKIFFKSLALLLLIGLAVWAIRSDSQSATRSADASPLATQPPPPGDASWRQAPLWDDGKAEFCAYEVSWARYGKRYPGRALLILVKEPWAPDLDVKADQARPDGFDVLKLNHVRDVPTGIYTYHQMASVYLRRDTGALQKLAATSSEACGVSTAEVRGGRLATRSYFDGEGDRALPYPAGAVPEDGLPALLRDYVAAAPPETLAVFPALMTSRFQGLEPRRYQVEKRPADPAGGGAGEGAVELRLTDGPAFLSYVFETAPPHRLLRFERDDGTLYRMAKCERIAYWQMHDPGGEAWLPEATR